MLSIAVTCCFFSCAGLEKLLEVCAHGIAWLELEMKTQRHCFEWSNPLSSNSTAFLSRIPKPQLRCEGFSPPFTSKKQARKKILCQTSIYLFINYVGFKKKKTGIKHQQTELPYKCNYVVFHLKPWDKWFNVQPSILNTTIKWQSQIFLKCNLYKEFECVYVNVFAHLYP